MKTYTYDDAYQASKEYFNGNDLAAKVFVDKYALRNNKGEFLETNPEDMHQRLAKEFAKVDAKYGDTTDRMSIYLEALKNFARIVPQGSPMAAVGNAHQYMSASNCVVIESPEDDMGSIIDSGKELAQLYKRRCGVGIDISTLRPEGSLVNNAARSTTGAWSFADFYSYITRMVGQNSRRGALMVTLSIHHPDVIKFITMKQDLTKVTGANVSLRLSDEFLEAVDKDKEYELRFPVDSDNPKISEKIKAREVWDIIVKSATKTAEPGLIMWDNMVNNLPAHCYEGFFTISTNPCCFAKDSQVMVVTNNGIKEIKQISSEDLIWVDSKKTWAKTSGYFDAGLAEVFKVKFFNNKELFITANHKLEKITKHSNLTKLVKLKDLKVGDLINAHKNKVLFDNNLGIYENDVSRNYKIKSINSIGIKEVGCIEVDRFHKFTANGVISGNSEIALSAYDSCRLISINLTGYVKNPFSQSGDAFFDFKEFKKDVHLAMQMADNLVDIELDLIDRIKNVCKAGPEKELWNKLYNAGQKGRRTGLGTHGLADTLAQLCILYDSDGAMTFVDELYKTLRDEAYSKSIELAKTRGAFPVFNWEKEKDCAFIKRLPKSIKNSMKENGRRNIALLTQAPTGSVSLLSKVGEFNTFNVSSGVEPVFRNSYTRRKKINPDDKNTRVDYVDVVGDSWQEFTVFHSNVLNYINTCDGFISEMMDDFAAGNSKLPDYFVTSDQIDWTKRIELQGIEQKYIDHSISSTINLPKGTSTETVSELYLNSWKRGLKGVTVYVDGSRDGVLISSKKEVDDDGRPTKIKPSNSPARPRELPADILHAVVNGTSWTILIGLLNNEPYEMFMGKSDNFDISKKYTAGKIIKTKKGIYSLSDQTNDIIIDDIVKSADDEDGAWITRMMSMSLRHGIPLEHLVKQLSKDGSVVDINKVLSRLLKKYLKRKDSSSNSCPNCSSSNLKYEDGCCQCLDCSWSGCS